MKILREWKDALGKQVALKTSQAAGATIASSKTNEERFKELTDYMIKHKGSLTSKAEVVRLDDGGFTYKEHWNSPSSSSDSVLTLLVGYSRFNSSWRYELYLDKTLVKEVQGSGWIELLEELEKYFHVPKIGSPEYKSLCEWVDAKGNKINGASSQPGKIPDQTYRYKRLLAQIDSDGFCKYTVNTLDNSTLDITLHNGVEVQLERQPHFPIYKLTIEDSSMYYDDYEDVLKALIEEGIIGETDLCEASSIADDFKEYENLWD